MSYKELFKLPGLIVNILIGIAGSIFFHNLLFLGSWMASFAVSAAIHRMIEQERKKL